MLLSVIKQIFQAFRCFTFENVEFRIRFDKFQNMIMDSSLNFTRATYLVNTKQTNVADSIVNCCDRAD